MDQGYGAVSDLRASSVGGALIAKQAAETSTMEVVLRTLAERVERLMHTVHHVEQRFSAVVRPEPPTPATTATDRPDGRGTRSSSSLGNSIEQRALDIEAATNRLQSMLQRCEL